jgi:hypothetical protein
VHYDGPAPVSQVDECCAFDGCDAPVAYRLTARWRDGLTWRRDVCRLHVARGIQSLQDFRGRKFDSPISITLAGAAGKLVGNAVRVTGSRGPPS